MAHDIYAGKFASFKEPAWHSIGTVFTEPLTCSEATKLAGADYEVVKVPRLVKYQGEEIELVYDLVRARHGEEPPAYYGTVGEDYQVMNNMDIARVLDPLAKKFQTETVGALGDGKKVFWTFATGSYEIKGEEVRGFILVTEGKDGKAGLKIAVTPVRVVCQNTLTLGLKQGTIMANFSHHNRPGDELAFWAETMPRVEQANLATRQAMNILAETKLKQDDIAAIIHEAFPFPKLSAKASVKLNSLAYKDLPEEFRTQVDTATASNDYYRTRQLGFRMGTIGLLETFNQEYPATANTAWAVVNAVAEHEDHRPVSGDVRGSAIFGDRMYAKQRAFTKAFALAGIK